MRMWLRLEGAMQHRVQGPDTFPHRGCSMLRNRSYTVVIQGWQVGMRKISLTKILQSRCSIRLKEAKAAVDSIVAGERMEFGFETLKEARDFLEEASAVGAVARLEGPDGIR